MGYFFAFIVNGGSLLPCWLAENTHRLTKSLWRLSARH